MKKIITVLAAAAIFGACSPNGSNNAVSNDSFVTNDTGANREGTSGASTGNSESTLQPDSSTKLADSTTNRMNGSNTREDSSKNETSKP